MAVKGDVQRRALAQHRMTWQGYVVEAGMDVMEVGILGPLSARAGSMNLVPRAQQQRQVFTQLAIAAGRMVRVSDMSAELWGERPPNSAVTVIQTYVGSLRKNLARALGRSMRDIAGEVLVTRPDGYTLSVDPDVVDANRFESLARLGSRLLVDGRPAEAASALADALALWRGPALADMRTGPLLELDVTRLTVARLAALEQRIEADLDLGRHYEVLAELAELTVRYPLNETLLEHYMLALHRTGRRTDALNAYHQLRDVLTTELGLEPCRSVQRVHQAILEADPELDRADRWAARQAAAR